MEFDETASVQATVEWVEKLLQCDDYSQTLLENAVDGEVLRMLAGSREELEKAGFKKLGHRAKLFLFFEKLASSCDNNQKTGITQSRSNYVDCDRHGEHVDTSERAVNDASRRQSTERRLSNSRSVSSVDGEAAINVQQTTAKWPTYDQIFKQRALGKVLLQRQVSEGFDKLACRSSEGKKQTRYDPLAQLMSDEPQLMSNILKGGKIGFYVLKERPTSEESNPLKASDLQLGKVVHVARSYSHFISSAKLSENLDLAKWLTDSNSVNIDLLGDIKPETTAAAKESNESFKACDGPLPTEEEEDIGKGVHSKGTSEVKPAEEYSRRSQSFREQGSPVASATSQENDELQLQNGSQIDRKEEILPITRSAFVDLTKLQDLKSKLGDEAFSVIAMVLTDSLNKDEVPTRLKDFIAKQNKSCPNGKPFQGHSTWSVGKKTKMVVEWAFDSQRIQLVGLAKSKQGKLIISRSNVELLNSSS
ncbi:hypothetical protein R1sor_016376 [Riccia sorocarpa]|uniref:SAM domain-containing protein n=1 Tax=Riccia sorocarpa TaxID=122646 RepID=A0ABD3HHK6_9MARC